MAKLGIITILATIIGTLTFATMTAPQAVADEKGEKEAAGPCVTKDPKTAMVKDACTKGGQKAAKEAMQAFAKEKGIKSCNKCHTKLAPKYELKKDGLEQFQKLGGK